MAQQLNLKIKINIFILIQNNNQIINKQLY